jgi:hypothetical protein
MEARRAVWRTQPTGWFQAGHMPGDGSIFHVPWLEDKKSGRSPAQAAKPFQVTRNGGFVAFESPDGKTLFYTKFDQNANLWRSAADGSGETEVLKGVAFRGFVVTADRVYYLRQESNGSFAIRRYVIATREDSQIVSLTKPVFLGLSMSPDGKYLIYSQRLEASNLMLVEDFH